MIAIAVVCGGATRPGALGDIAVQLAAVPLLAVAVDRLADTPQRWAVSIVLGCALILLLATSLLAGATLATALTPWLSCVVPVAVFLSTLLLNGRERQGIAMALLALAAGSVLLGLLQVAQGPASLLRPFTITNVHDAVGFFANRNHFAALLYSVLPFCAVWLTLALQARDHAGGGWLRSRSLLSFVAALTLLAMLVAGLALARSRAGVALALVGMVGAILICVAGRPVVTGRRGRWSSVQLGAGTVVFALLFAAQLGLERVLLRFEQPVIEDLRIPVAATTWDLALMSLPFGSGLGSFVPAYAAAERTGDLFNGWVNRAHNDYLEFFLEGGFVAAMLMAAFLGWFSMRVADVWFCGFSGHGGLSRLLAQAGTITAGLLLAHSAVDYPLRTSAIAAVFAFAAALTVPPLSHTEPVPRSSRRRSRPPEPPPVKQARYAASARWPDASKR